MSMSYYSLSLCNCNNCSRSKIANSSLYMVTVTFLLYLYVTPLLVHKLCMAFFGSFPNKSEYFTCVFKNEELSNDYLSSQNFNDTQIRKIMRY